MSIRDCEKARLYGAAIDGLTDVINKIEEIQDASDAEETLLGQAYDLASEAQEKLLDAGVTAGTVEPPVVEIH